MNARLRRFLGLGTFLVCWLGGTAERAAAWSTMMYRDAEVVERSDVIVVGHVARDSLKLEPGKGSYEHRAVLVVKGVLKGKASAGQELPVILHYGLRPIPDAGKAGEPDLKISLTGAKEMILFEDNPSMGLVRRCGDIYQDHIWLLRKHRDKASPDADIDHTDALGVWDPEDVQPVEKKAELEKLVR